MAGDQGVGWNNGISDYHRLFDDQGNGGDHLVYSDHGVAGNH